MIFEQKDCVSKGLRADFSVSFTIILCNSLKVKIRMGYKGNLNFRISDGTFATWTKMDRCSSVGI